MKTEINDNELDMVNGGNYYINKNNLKVAFTTIKGVAYQLKNCTANQAIYFKDALIGKYNTTKEYDKTCVKALKAKGWL